MSTAPSPPSPPSTDQALSTALEHHRAGRLPQAEAIYRQVLAADPNNADALHLLGLVAHAVGQNDHAERLIRRALVLVPDSADVTLSLAHVLRASGKSDESIAAYRCVIQLAPERADAHTELGAMLHARGDGASAAQSFATVTMLCPDDAAAHHNLCAALVTLNRWDDAVVAGARAVELRPDWADAWANYGAALYRVKRIDDSVAAYQRAIALRPDFADAHANLALALLAQQKLADAEAACREAIRLDPANAQAYANLGNVMKRQSRFAEGLAAYRKSVELNPRNRSAWANVLLSLSYLDTITPAEMFAAHRDWAMTYAEPLLRESKASPPTFTTDRDPDRKLRVGYVSPDLFAHAVACFLEPLLAGHDRASAVEIFCYSDADHDDAVTARLRCHADGWRDVHGITDAHLLDLIRRDSIDILIDLAGHTRRNRLMVFAARAAPVQITYLGYPATTAVAAMDYRLTDAWADPPGMTESQFTERLLRLDRCAWCYRSPDDAPQPAARPPCVESGHVRFGSFNKHHKISPSTIDAWVKLLHAVENSRLLLKSNRLRDDVSRRRLLDQFTARGVDESRVEVIARADSIADHLATYARVDVALDTFPYNGTTTTCEAIFMGVPVVALAGRTHVSRVGVSLLSAASLGELIAQDVDGYIAIAAAQARDRERLTSMRSDLRPRIQASPLMDARTFARSVESAYREAWRAWCRSLHQPQEAR